MKVSVLSLKKQHNIGYFQITCKYQKYFMTDPINSIFDDFCIGIYDY